MASIDEIIKQEINPFDRTPLKNFNFWNEESNPNQTVDSIHQEAIAQVTETLDLVVSDSCTRTLILAGDSGSGKSYLLRRLKEQLNQRAFFAYIEPWVDSDYIWRHVLRYTVDSLMRIPAGQQESQLLLWLKSLSAFRDESLKKRLLGERGLFIHNLQGTYPSGIYQAKQFFGVLYDLTRYHSIPPDSALNSRLSGVPEAAWMRATCDNAFVMKLNGKTVAQSRDWQKPVHVDFGDEER